MTTAYTAFSVVELYSLRGGSTTLGDNKLFRTRELAMSYLRDRYTYARAVVDEASSERSADYSEDGWYEVVSDTGDTYEGYVSEELKIYDSKDSRKAVKESS